MGITLRERDIIMSIIESDKYNPITINAIAEKIDVSSRTVLRTIPYIEKFLKANGFNFVKKPGVGLILKETQEGKKKLLELVNSQFLIEDYSPKQRGLFILCELLLAKEPIKLYYFTSILNVSEGTLSNDLDKLEDWIRERELKLVRKPGLGIYIEGEEDKIRQAISSMVYEFVDEEQIINIIKEKISLDKKDKNKLELDIKNRLLSLIEKDTIKTIEKYVSQMEGEEELHLADSAYIALIVHLSLAMQRIKNEEKIDFNEEALNELRNLPEFDIARKLSEKLAKAFDVSIPDGEIGYITMHLKGAKLDMVNSKEDYKNITQFHLSKLAMEIIKTAEIETSYPLTKDKKLEQDLVNHLGPAVSRLKMNLVIRNPLLDRIKEDYKDIYNVSKRCCKVLKNIGKGTIPESEIAYIAMHIAAAIERIKNNLAKPRIIVACGSGIGTSRLLSAKLLILFPNIDIVDTVSSFTINNKMLLEKDVDLIISTINLDIDFPCITVSPMLTDKDKEKINKFLNMPVNRYRVSGNEKVGSVNKEQEYEDVLTLTSYGSAIKSLLDNFEVYEDNEITTKEDLIEKTSILFSKNDSEKELIKTGLQYREKLGSTFIEELGISLLHCTLDSFQGVKFGLIRPKREVIGFPNLKVVVVIIVPKKNNTILLKTVSEISEAIIQDENLVKDFIAEDKRQLLNYLENLYTKFYFKIVQKITTKKSL